MLITNQYRNEIANLKKISLIRIESNENEFDIVIKCDGDWETLGTYKNYKRAQEILSEITDTFRKVAKVEDKTNRQPRFYNIPRVYEMPKE